MSGAHINPAVTLAFAVRRKFAWAKVLPYMAAQVIGAFVGAALVFLVYFNAIDAFNIANHSPRSGGNALATYSIFATFPASYFHGGYAGPLIDQIVGTAFLLIFVVALIDLRNTAVGSNLAPLAIGLAVAAIGMSYGANAGYAINPARDFGPRLFAYFAGWGRILPGTYNNGIQDSCSATTSGYPSWGRSSAASSVSSSTTCSSATSCTPGSRWRRKSRGLSRRLSWRSQGRARRARVRSRESAALTNPRLRPIGPASSAGKRGKRSSHAGLRRRRRPGGSSSTRFMIFDHSGNEVGKHQLEHEQILPQAGWVEHNPVEIWERTAAVVQSALHGAGLVAADLAAVGVTNQRETTIVWNPKTGRSYYNAIVWQDTRTDRSPARFDCDERGGVIRRTAGLPPATYFSGGKLQWILENVDGVREAAERGVAVFGNTDFWVFWNLTGGVNGGMHVTDPTNASRTMLMNLETLDWDEELLSFFRIPRQMLPAIRPSSAPGGYGELTGLAALAGVPLTGDLGDQQAATVGQVCFTPGEAKNTYGTGNFMLLNTGEEVVRSKNGLLTTVCYQFGENKPIYALEGSIAVTGSAVQWLRDQLGIISGAAEVEPLARQVTDNGGIYFVPAFSGLFAPYWRSDARGAIVGLSRYNTNAHLARATLEAICYQSRDVSEAMEQDSGVHLEVLKVDGGVTANDLCMQLQADILGVPVSRPVVAETTALGAAYAAGLATKFWSTPEELRTNWNESKRWLPQWTEDQRASGYRGWKKAVERTLNWVEVD